MGDEPLPPIVLDTGSYACRAGLAGEEAPRLVVRSLASCAEAGRRPVCYGRDCLERDAAELRRLATAGRVDFALVGDFWRALAGVDPQLDFAARPVLCARSALTPVADVLRAAELFFEELRAPLYHCASEALLALYSSGRVTGLVLNAGHTTTGVAAVFDGALLPAAQLVDRFGGADATEFLQRELRLGERATVELKERELRAPMEFERETAEAGTLPDGQRLSALLLAGEAAFQPRLLGSDAPGAHEACFEALLRTDGDLRRELAGNIVLAGGSAALAQFNDRFLRDFSALLPTALKPRCYHLPEKAHAVWAGGSVVAAVAAFQPQWVSRADYDEGGPAAVLRRCV